MKRQILGVIVGSAFATALVAAQGAQTPPPAAAPQGEKAKDVTVVGCLVQGSAPAIYLLEDARMNPEDKNEKARKFFLSGSATDLKANLNKEVRVIGQAETKEPPAGKENSEQDLPKLTVKTIASVADRCTSVQ